MVSEAEPMNYALITGASKGIGKALALELARKGYNLLLTARSADLLKALAIEIHGEHKVAVHYKACDLTDPAVPAQLAEWCRSNEYDVDILVNNAGFGLWGAFDELSAEGQLEMMNLNMNALVALTHHFIPILSKSKTSYVLNVASLASFLAIPHFSIYAATKAFVLSFSRSLRFDVANKGVRVSCLCPGATESEFLQRAGMESIGAKAKGFYMSAEAVAKIGVRGMLRGKAEIVPGMLNKIAALGIWAAPKILVETGSAMIYRKRTPN